MTSAGEPGEEYTLFTLSGGRSKPLTVNLTVDGTPLSMEVNTGSSRSIISEATFHKCFPEKLLSQSLVRLRTYSGNEVTVCGELSVMVEYKEQKVTLPLLIVKVQQGVIQPVDFADWAAPIVPVLKSDKSSVRICGDFKVTVNKFTKVDRYPIPKVDELLSTLAGGKLFTKLDLTQAYQQVCLDEESRKMVVINTHKGLFQFNCMPFGISSAPGIFQRVMESLLQGIPHVVVYLDDILITGKSHEEHLACLKEVLSRLEKSGLHLKKEKCHFFQEEVEYLGFKIDAQGIHPTLAKLEAIREAPSPGNVSELKAYLGLLSYYSKFLPNLSQEFAPLYRLLQKSSQWRWTQTEQTAFEKSKKLLSSDSVLIHFDASKDIVLACDASQSGLGVVLSHKMSDGSERPVAFASRTLSPAEKNYSQVEKEALACVFGVKKFHIFVWS